MTTTTRTVLGVFDDYATAKQVVDELVESGFSRSDIQITTQNDYAMDAARGGAGLSGEAQDKSGGGIAGFFRRLFGDETYEHEGSYYAEAVRRGSTVVAVATNDMNAERAADIMDDRGAVDIDRRAASWKEQGYKAYDESAPAYNAEQISREREMYGKQGERSIPVVREELEVGKRMVQRGGVRIFNRMHEEPVEEKVKLREEHVRVDRRRADRPATEADLRARDEVVEVREMAEEPVVGKRTRVVEEVVVGKETTERTETVRDKVRRSDVNVEKMGSSEFNEDFRKDFNTRYGSTAGASWDRHAPAYEYGYRMASDDRYRGKRWEDVETTLRSDYERSYPGSKWEQMKDSIRYGWNKMTGRY
jgi:uncharacterized protein (TIGR02271 family)